MISGQTKNDIILYLGIDKLSKSKAENVLVKLENNIQRALSLEILSLLSKENQKEFEKVMETEDKEKITSFLKEKVPFLSSLAKVTAQSVVKEFKFMIA